MTSHDGTHDDGVGEITTGGDEMKLRQWYVAATPLAEARQAAIDRLLLASAVRRSTRPAERMLSGQRRWWIASAVAASIVAAIGLTWTIRQAPAVIAPVGRDDTRLVAFEVRLPSRAVHHVALTGDFNGWDSRAMPMQRQGSSDVWKIAIALPPGRHVYSFVVDGTEWVIDPLAPRAEFDELGPANVIAISGAGD